MKLRNTLIITLALTGQLAFADGSKEATTPAAATAGQPAAVQQPVEQAATAKQIKALETDVSPSLQSKLDALMSFDAVPGETSRQEVASAH
ncbi:MAG: hypothetical protein ACPG1A_10845 [Halioglobus sp.]